MCGSLMIFNSEGGNGHVADAPEDAPCPCHQNRSAHSTAMLVSLPSVCDDSRMTVKFTCAPFWTGGGTSAIKPTWKAGSSSPFPTLSPRRFRKYQSNTRPEERCHLPTSPVIVLSVLRVFRRRVCSCGCVTSSCVTDRFLRCWRHGSHARQNMLTSNDGPKQIKLRQTSESKALAEGTGHSVRGTVYRSGPRTRTKAATVWHPMWAPGEQTSTLLRFFQGLRNKPATSFCFRRFFHPRIPAT